MGRLASVGHVISDADHLEAIFNGLPAYDTFVILVSTRSDNYIVEIESLLLIQEARIENHLKELDSNPRIH